MTSDHLPHVHPSSVDSGSGSGDTVSAGPAAGLGVGPDLASVAFDDAGHDSQADPRAFELVGSM